MTENSSHKTRASGLKSNCFPRREPPSAIMTSEEGKRTTRFSEKSLNLERFHPLCGVVRNSFMISRAQTFGFSHRLVRKISTLDITRSTPLGSSPHPATSSELLTAVVFRICNVQLPVVPRSSLLGSMLTHVHSSVYRSMRTPFD